MSFKVVVEKTLFAVVVAVDDLPHLHLLLKDYRGMQAYIDGFTHQDEKWCIEFYYLGMEPVIAEYNTAEKWRAVLLALKPYLK